MSKNTDTNQTVSLLIWKIGQGILELYFKDYTILFDKIAPSISYQVH